MDLVFAWVLLLPPCVRCFILLLGSFFFNDVSSIHVLYRPQVVPPKKKRAECCHRIGGGAEYIKKS